MVMELSKKNFIKETLLKLSYLTKESLCHCMKFQLFFLISYSKSQSNNKLFFINL